MLISPVRVICSAVISALFLCAAPVASAAEAWKPSKPIEIVIGTTPGGPQDRTGRLIARVLTERKLVDVPVNVVNRPGGGGAVGLASLNTHPGDAHYLMVNATTMLTNHITGRTPLGPADFTPIAIMGVEYVGVSVRKDSPIASGRDLIDRLRKDPASLSVAIGTALGNATHLSFALAMRSAGVEIRRMRNVVFQSGGDSMTAALGGHVDASATAASSVLPQLRAGTLRMLAIGAPQRLKGDLAGVPTWKELGANSTLDLWRGLAAPKGLTPAQIAFWNGVLSKVVAAEEWKQELEANQLENIYKNSAETAKHWKDEYDEVKAVLLELGLAK